jgi:hypothetical protein
MPESRYTCTTLDGFVETLRRLLDAAWGPDWGELGEEVTNLNDPENVKLPQVIFHLVSRVPNEKLTPLKKKFYETFPDPDYPGYNVEIWRKWYDCKVAFHCYARTNREARHLANKLEAFLDTYTGYFKEQGLSELVFLGEDEPERTRLSGGLLPVRTLLYLARVEEVHVVRGKLLEDITINVRQSEE